jgi:hypothetical protein
MARRMDDSSGRVTPAGLNAAIALLFMLGSACFVLGSFPGYLDAVGGTADGVTYFVGSLLFTTASAAQLVQAQTPALATASPDSQHRPARPQWRAWRPRDRGWMAAATQFPGTLFFNVSTAAALVHNASASFEDQHVWRPDMFGSTLFLVSSGYAVLAISDLKGSGQRLPVAIAWTNMLGSVLFMWSAIAAYVLPSGTDLDTGVAVAGTLLGAACFFVGAALMFPAWHQAVHHAALQGEPT